MKNDYEVSQAMLFNAVDEETRPKRFAIATNALMVVQNDSGRYLLMVNVDPIRLNKWYPVFVSHNALHTFAANDYGELVEEFNSASDKHGFSIETRRAACIKCLEEFVGSSFEVEEIEKIDKDRYWIKYSKSQDIWTMYLFENYVFFVNNIIVPQRDDIALIPLDDNLDWVETGIYKNLPIVDNMYELLKDENFRHILNKK